MIEKLPDDILRKHKGISFTGVTTVFFCHDGKGHVFLAKRSKNARDERGRWDIGGGGLKWGVTAIDNLRRELLEEYGAVPKNTKFLGYRDVMRELENDTKTHWIALDYLVEVDRNEVHIAEPEMFDDSGWFQLDELPKPLHSQLPYAFEKYSAEFNPSIF